MRGIEVIDSNAYLGKWPYWNMRVNTGEQLAEYLKKNRIDRAIVSSLRSVFVDAEDGNTELMQACRSYPDVLYGLATLTPFSEKKGAGMQGLMSGTFKGIKIYPQHHGYPLANSTRVIEAAEDLRVPVVLPCRLILSWNLPTLGLGEILALVRAHRGVPFVISGANYEAMAILSTEERPENLYVETSCLQMWQGIESLLDSLGQDRVLLGTGAPVQYAQAGRSNVLNSRLSEKQKKKVASSNARDLFDL